MNRKEFLSAIGLSGGAVILATCLNGCSKDMASGSVGAAPTVDFTLDLTDAANAALNTPGGYIYSKGVIVAKTLAGEIIAVSQACTHEGVTVRYISGSNLFYCASHGAQFSASGAVVSGPANRALKQYNVSVSGNTVTVSG